jgi:UDP-N-acetylglucosamine--N-acetylmuramyl-(pentapeptide) pyrophosphoryl-undecaprenol N-acetylglucosamine transferase
MPPKPILIMAGGTGGHVYPALAVADFLRERGVPLYWLGTRHGLEARVVPERRYPLLTIDIRGLRGNGIAGWLLAPFRLGIALGQALLHLRRCRPAAVLGMGGFVSGPGGVAAWLLRLPLVIHEQNAVAGLTNRLLAPLARAVLQGFPGSFRNGDRARTTGNPVRADIAGLRPPVERLAGRAGPIRLLVLGGSQGARALNRLLPAALGRLHGVEVQIRHQAGSQHLDDARQRYRAAGVGNAEITPYIEDMADAYAWADLVLCRAGALTVAELCVAGIAAILVPYPFAVDDHQTANARHLTSAGGAVLLPEKDLDADALAAVISELASDRARLLDMAERSRSLGRPDATRAVGEICLEAAGG